MNIKFLSLVSAALLLAGCATSTMTGIMESWRGAHIDDVTAQWGNPSEIRPYHGNKLYVWYHQKSFGLPTTAYTTVDVIGNKAFATTTTGGGGVLSGNCTRILEVSPSQVVVSYRWSGGNCPFLELMEYSDWRKPNH